MHHVMHSRRQLSAADTPNIDSAGAVSEFVFAGPVVITRVGLFVTTAVNPDNSVAMTAALSRRPTIGSASSEVNLGTWLIMAANAANLAVGTVVYKDLHIDDADGEAPEDFNANNKARRFEAPNSNLVGATIQGGTLANPYMIPPSQSFAITLETNAEADSGAVYSWVEFYELPINGPNIISTATLNRDTSNEA